MKTIQCLLLMCMILLSLSQPASSDGNVNQEGTCSSSGGASDCLNLDGKSAQIEKMLKQLNETKKQGRGEVERSKDEQEMEDSLEQLIHRRFDAIGLYDHPLLSHPLFAYMQQSNISAEQAVVFSEMTMGYLHLTIPCIIEYWKQAALFDNQVAIGENWENLMDEIGRSRPGKDHRTLLETAFIGYLAAFGVEVAPTMYASYRKYFERPGQIGYFYHDQILKMYGTDPFLTSAVHEMMSGGNGRKDEGMRRGTVFNLFEVMKSVKASIGMNVGSSHVISDADWFGVVYPYFAEHLPLTEDGSWDSSQDGVEENHREAARRALASHLGSVEAWNRISDEDIFEFAELRNRLFHVILDQVKQAGIV